MNLTVKKAMTKNPFTLPEKSLFSELIQIMSMKGIGSVIVTDENQTPVQIITLRDILKVLSSGNFDGYLSDVLSILGKKKIPLITINSSELLINALELMKTNNISHLPVINQKGKLTGILSFRDLLREFPGIVFIDPLTGVNNRNYLTMLGLKIQKTKTELCVLMIDIDNFKNINDSYGHNAGDKVLKEFAKTIRENVRGYDEVIRYGGEEFIVILYRCNVNYATNIAEKLRQKVKLLKIPEIENTSFTVSIGVSTLKENENLTEAIERADRAMYLAKKEGKDCVKTYSL